MSAGSTSWRLSTSRTWRRRIQFLYPFARGNPGDDEYEVREQDRGRRVLDPRAREGAHRRRHVPAHRLVEPQQSFDGVRHRVRPRHRGDDCAAPQGDRVRSQPPDRRALGRRSGRRRARARLRQAGARGARRARRARCGEARCRAAETRAAPRGRRHARAARRSRACRDRGAVRGRGRGHQGRPTDHQVGYRARDRGGARRRLDHARQAPAVRGRGVHGARELRYRVAARQPVARAAGADRVRRSAASCRSRSS